MSVYESSSTAEQVDRANATDRTPVVFVHGLWLLPSSWDRWAAVFDEAGFAPVTADWPDDPATVAEANAHPDGLAGTVPWAIANASYKRQKQNPGVTEITEIPDRGHALVIDSGWREVADTALRFVQRFA